MILLLLVQLLFATPKAEIHGTHIKITGTNTVSSIDEIGRIYHETRLIDPKLARSDEEKEWIRLTNLEEKWLNSKRYTFIRGQRVEVTFAQEVEILRHQARKNAGLPSLPLTEDEKTYLDLQLQTIRDAVDKKVASELYKNKFRAEIIQTTHDAESAVMKAADISKSGNIFIVVLDGMPYFLGQLPSGNIMEYRLQDKTVNLKSDLGLSCNLPTSPSSHPNVKLKLDNYFATLSHLSYSPANSMFVADTIENTAFCNVAGNGGDRIFAGGFEAGQQ